MRFAGKVALVTGAAQGIGRATALRFAQDGADVVIADVNLAGAEEATREIEGLGRAALAVKADVMDERDCEQMIAAITERFGHLDIVFANAGIGGGAPVNELPVERWDRVIAVNLRGVFLTCKYSIPALIKAGGGAIITMSSSMAGWDTSSTGAAYMASKEGVSGLTKSLALQLGGHGIRVNAILSRRDSDAFGLQAWYERSRMAARYDRFAKRIPLRRVGQPEDVAAVVAFLASDDARHVSGSMLLIDGGQTLQSWSNAPSDETYPLDGNW